MSVKDNNFFPLCAELIEDSVFKKLPITEKLFLIQLISDSNQNPDGWYKADLEYSVILNISINKIRQARPKLKKLGLINYISGQLKRNRKIATEYTYVKFSRPEPPFSKIHRYTYESLLGDVRESTLTRTSLLFWLLSAYKNGRNSEVGFSVLKSFYKDYGLQSKAIISGAIEIKDQFKEDFVRQNHHKITFDAWFTYSDPDVDSKNRENKERADRALQRSIEQYRKESNHDDYWKSKRAYHLQEKGKSEAYIMRDLAITRAEVKVLIADEIARLEAKA